LEENILLKILSYTIKIIQHMEYLGIHKQEHIRM